MSRQPTAKELEQDPETAVHEWLSEGFVKDFCQSYERHRRLEMHEGAPKMESLVRFLNAFKNFVFIEEPPPIIIREMFAGDTLSLRKDVLDIWRQQKAQMNEETFLSRFLLHAFDDPSQPSQSPAAPSEYEKAQILHAAFRRPFKGSALKRFQDVLKLCDTDYDPEKHYGRSLAFLQSSGTGKSRLVGELALEYPLISVCFREGKGANAGWPLGDHSVTSFFGNHRGGQYYGEEMAAAFLGAFIETTHSTIFPMVPKEANMFSSWQYGLPESDEVVRRKGIFDQVVKRANFLLESNHDKLKQAQDWMEQLPPPGNMPALMASRTPSAEKREQKKLSKASVAWHATLFDMFCIQPFTKLAERLLELKPPGTPFLVAFDECSNLGTNPTSRPTTSMTLIAMQHLIKAAEQPILGVKFWFLLLDTNSSAYKLAPSGPGAPSSRLTEDMAPLPPFMYLGYNQMAPNRDNQRKAWKTAMSPTELLHLQNFGRPLWHGLPLSSLIHAAQEKLFFRYYAGGDTLFAPTLQHHAFSAFAVRFPLELHASETATRFAEKQVSNHMRILIASQNGMLITKAPSEPILAIASAVALTSGPGFEVYMTALDTLLKELVLEDLIIGRGQQGELCSRLILILARDKTAVSEGGFLTNNSLQVRCVSVESFLKTLLGNTLGKSDLTHNLWNSTSRRWLNFTHFIALNNIIHEIPINMLIDAWACGAAFQCAHNQPIIDVFWPEYHGSLEELFDPNKLRVGFAQIKARSSATEKSTGEALTGPPIIYDPESKDRVKHDDTIVLLMDLGTSSHFRTGSTCSLTHRRATVPSKKRLWEGYAGQGEHESKNFFINVRGRTSVSYPLISGELEKIFASLFQTTLVSVPNELRHMEDEMERLMDPMEFQDDDEMPVPQGGSDSSNAQVQGGSSTGPMIIDSPNTPTGSNTTEPRPKKKKKTDNRKGS